MARKHLASVVRVALIGLCATVSPVFAAASPAAASSAEWTAVDAGATHTCGILAGRLYCWGNDSVGQVGNGGGASSEPVTSPQQITNATDWTSVAAGTYHTCAIRGTGKLYCWGSDGNGQVGNGGGTSTTAVVSPQQITTATDWKSVSAGDSHTCAIRSTGKLYCWGYDGSGQVGNGGSGGDPPVPSPVQITTATDWKSVSAGGSHTCAIRSTGKLYCWGNDFFGQVGNGGGTSTAAVVSPQLITTATDWSSVSAGGTHTCAIRGVGKLYCWGSDSVGQVGNGSGGSGDVASPVQITSATDWKSATAGVTHTCAIRSVGKLYCWGSDGHGQVGNGGSSSNNVNSPVQITSATDWRSVAAGDSHTCAIRGAGKLYCWGYDGFGQLGNGGDSTSDVPSPALV